MIDGPFAAAFDAAAYRAELAEAFLPPPGYSPGPDAMTICLPPQVTPPSTAADTAHSAHSTQPAMRPHRATLRVEDNTPSSAGASRDVFKGVSMDVSSADASGAVAIGCGAASVPSPEYSLPGASSSCAVATGCGAGAGGALSSLPPRECSLQGTPSAGASGGRLGTSLPPRECSLQGTTSAGASGGVVGTAATGCETEASGGLHATALRPLLLAAMQLLRWAHVYTYYNAPTAPNAQSAAACAPVPPPVRLALSQLERHADWLLGASRLLSGGSSSSGVAWVEAEAEGADQRVEWLVACMLYLRSHVKQSRE